MMYELIETYKLGDIVRVFQGPIIVTCKLISSECSIVPYMSRGFYGYRLSKYPREQWVSVEDVIGKVSTIEYMRLQKLYKCDTINKRG